MIAVQFGSCHTGRLPEEPSKPHTVTFAEALVRSPVLHNLDLAPFIQSNKAKQRCVCQQIHSSRDRS